jgi:hypothetical protein
LKEFARRIYSANSPLRTLVPRLIAALGTQRNRFSTAGEIQSYTGIAPVVVQSGNTRSTRSRKAYPHFLRQTFHEWAAHSIKTSQWARTYYEQQISRGKKHHASVRALAYKWIRILFRCWKDQIVYNEDLHPASLNKRQTSADHSPVNLQWKNVAGFLKLSAETH